MTTPTTVAPASRSARLPLMMDGLAAIAFGIAVLAWPTKTAVALAAVIAVYAIISGVIHAVLGVLGKGLGLGARIGHVLLGVLYVIAGAYAFGSLHHTAAFMAVFLAFMVGAMWVFEGLTALFTLGSPGTGSKALTIVFAIISVVAGWTLLSSPLWGAVFLWWLLGVGLLALGILNVLRGLTGKKA